ncbi:MAG: hypothetical protein ACRC1T_09955 [Clostridium chrysemydis]|uniref:hypothetical protein n=1 Tax=Clostridium chrysemydis TaxID=2665504 RepID=UPI003F30C1DE
MNSMDIIRMNNEIIMRQVYMNLVTSKYAKIDNPITNILVNILLVICLLLIIFIGGMIIYDIYKDFKK